MDNFVASDVENLGRFRDEDEQIAVIEEVDEWVHVVWLILLEDVEGDAVATRYTLGAEYFVRWVIICGNSRIQAVETARCNEHGAIGHRLG